MDEAIREQMNALSVEQRSLLDGLLNAELADAVVEVVRRFKRVIRDGRNDQAAVAAGRVLMSLALKRKVLEISPEEQFTADWMREIQETESVTASGEL